MTHTPLRVAFREDLEAAHSHDPAPRSRLEVALGYPGVHAVWGYRVTHRMWQEPGLRLAARLLPPMFRTNRSDPAPPKTTLSR